MAKERMDMYMFVYGLNNDVKTRVFYYPKWPSKALSIMGGGEPHSVKEMTRRVCVCAAVVASCRATAAVDTTIVECGDDDTSSDDGDFDIDDGDGVTAPTGATPVPHRSTPASMVDSTIVAAPMAPIAASEPAATTEVATTAAAAPTPGVQNPAKQRRYQGNERASLGAIYRRPPSRRRSQPLVLVCTCGYCGRHVTCEQ
jgi:hypothetical protein